MVPLERCPVLVPAGTILPLGPVSATASQPLTELSVQVYPGADATFRLYTDAGNGYGYERGECAWIELRWDDAAQTLYLATPR